MSTASQNPCLPHDFEAAIFDLDGVVTQTAMVHAAAWKRLFDGYLQARAARLGEAFRPFDSSDDYLQYVDGKPRYDGVRSFLESRGIDLPAGSPSDSPQSETVCGLGNRKNALLLEEIERQGVEPYPTSVALIRELREHGVHTAVVSSSRNCARVLDAAGLAALFDVRVDGVTAAEMGLAGKPAPDLFLEAARRLHTDAPRSLVFEDALSGVEAGHRGGFLRVVGVDRQHQAQALREHGADIVVDDLARIKVAWETDDNAGPLPSALEHLAEIRDRLHGKTAAVFLDYDGTLTPIVARPELAVLGEPMRQTLRELVRHTSVAVVSGRDVEDVQRLVGLDDLVIAGGHGFDIAGPEGQLAGYQEGVRFLPEIDAAETDLRRALQTVSGVLIERKKFSVAVHYRAVGDADLDPVRAAVNETLRTHPRLRSLAGKKVFDLQPDIDWDKGKAVDWLLAALHLDRPDVVPIYVGDDVTDHDAFRALQGRGIGIVVGERDPRCGAAYALADTDEVRQFLAGLHPVGEHCGGDAQGCWSMVYEGFDAAHEGLREALCTLGNGYFATRGAAEEAVADEVHYPGTYIAGGYNRLKTDVMGQEVENEDLVNFPNWLGLTVHTADGAALNPACAAQLLSYSQELDMQTGILKRTARIRDARGRDTRYSSRRFVHQAYPHLAGIEVRIEPENWSGVVTIRSALDGTVTNAGVRRYRDLNGRHLRTLESSPVGDDGIYLQVETVQSRIRVAQVARTQLFSNGVALAPERTLLDDAGCVAQEMTVEVAQGSLLAIEKIVSLFTSRDPAISECGLEARRAIDRVWRFDSLLERQRRAWSELWKRCGLTVQDGDPRTMLIAHLHLFHLLQTVSANTIDLDVGVPARGLHGEAYRGHIFWDDLFIFPLLNFRCPEISRALLRYRHRRLEEARRAARDAGLRGALYPWQSGSDGREESQALHLNPQSQRWLADNSRLQRHINAAIAWSVWQYYQVTGDIEFLSVYGAEMIVEIARLWASLASYNAQHDRYEIHGVMGPDEYHDAYPGVDKPGLSNNAYTNVMAAWVMVKALEVIRLLPEDRGQALRANLEIGDGELAAWDRISRKMRICFHDDGIISQFEGYEKLEELDWDGLRHKHGDIHRLDRILEAAGDSCNRYRVSKQADALMLFYLFSADELRGLFERMGYPFERETIPRTIDYYLQRTSHGSTLSYMVHSWVLARSDRARSWTLLRRALESDIADIQGGTTQEGIHLGAMAGTIDLIQRAYTGLEVRDGVLWLSPLLPETLRGLSMRIHYRGHGIDVDVSHESLKVQVLSSMARPIKVGLNKAVYVLEQGSSIEVAI